MRLIIAGGRDLLGPAVWVFWHCDRLTAAKRPSAVLCGMARGIDQAGAEWARARDIPVWPFPADWDLYGRMAGPLRNRQMAKHADALIAFWDGQSRGTRDMIQVAKREMLKVRIVRVAQSAMGCQSSAPG